MRLVNIAVTIAAAAALAACSGESEAGNDSVDQVDSNIMFEEIGNDASALEAAGAANPLAAPEAELSGNSTEGANKAAPATEAPVFGETSGGDTGGNITQGNTTGQ